MLHDWLVCDVPHSCVSWFDLLSEWLMQIRDKYMCDTTRSCVTRPIHMSDTTHSYVTWLTHMWHDSFIYHMTHSCVKWLIHKWHDAFKRDVTHSYVIYSHVTWLIDMWHFSLLCDIAHPFMTWIIHTWHDWFIRDMAHWEWKMWGTGGRVETGWGGGMRGGGEAAGWGLVIFWMYYNGEGRGGGRFTCDNLTFFGSTWRNKQKMKKKKEKNEKNVIDAISGVPKQR